MKLWFTKARISAALDAGQEAVSMVAAEHKRFG